MFTGITTHAGSPVTAIVVLTGAAILRGGAASDDPNQDDQFLALLSQLNHPEFDAHLLCWEGASHAEQVRPGDAGQGCPSGA